MPPAPSSFITAKKLSDSAESSRAPSEILPKTAEGAISSKPSFIIVEYAVVAGVADNGVAVFGALRDIYLLILVYMPVDEVFGVIFFYQVFEAFKAAVGKRIEVVYMPCGGMGKKNIEAIFAHYFEP